MLKLIYCWGQLKAKCQENKKKGEENYAVHNYLKLIRVSLFFDSATNIVVEFNYYVMLSTKSIIDNHDDNYRDQQMLTTAISKY